MNKWQITKIKLNLALHITGKRNDGLHLLDSLVIFPNIGDYIKYIPHSYFTLLTIGKFAQELPEFNKNIIFYAIKYFCKYKKHLFPKIKFILNKKIPIASGIGGGSANAAKILHILQNISTKKNTLSKKNMKNISLKLGADVPVCYINNNMNTCKRITNIGNRLLMLCNGR